MMKNLLEINIVGIIDAYGAVHSRIVDIVNLSDETHERCFPNQCFHRWRWNFNNGLEKSCLSSEFDIEDWDKIRRHLTKKYSIKWWDNGYHNIDDIIKRFAK